MHLAGTSGGMKGHLSLLGDREEGPAPESFEDPGILSSNLILVYSEVNKNEWIT